jgi:hypothetical protein
MKHALYACAAASALFLTITLVASPTWVACADGDRAHCANETFHTLSACEAFNAAQEYGHEAVCLNG